MTAVGDARKRLSNSETGLSRPNSPNADPSESGALVGAQGVEAIRARLDESIREFHKVWPAPYSLSINLAIAADAVAELDRLTAALAAERARVAAAEAERDAVVALAQAAIGAHRDLHVLYGSTAVCGGGIGGQAMTQHCGVTCGYSERHEAQNDRWYAVESAYFRRNDGDPGWAAALTAAAPTTESKEDDHA